MSEKLKIVYRPLQELSPYAHNARTHSTEQVAQLVESIKQFGWTNPVLIDEKGEIIAGHGRVMAAEMLKMDSVPVIVLSGLTDEQKKAYRLADNRLPMNAGWDEDLLRMELSDLINADFDVSLTGFIPAEIDELLTDVLPGNGAPTTDLQMVLGSTAIANLRGKQSVLFKVNESGTEQLLREGVLGRLAVPAGGRHTAPGCG
ncbi:ParB/Srx family N-terminal domain-containing protein [Escherichia coli]|uniref:ParB/Srx family N-terminal domain-containing protein n=1 Tax=Escherichia coli TaxID=562 RepID=UPI0024818762